MIDASAVRVWAENPAGPVSQDMRRRALNVAAEAQRRAPVDTGNLRRRIHVTGPHRGERGPAWDVVADVHYAGFVHDGRRPGRMPPSSALAGWARRHGVAGGEYVIARAIAARGIPPRPFLVEALSAALR